MAPNSHEVDSGWLRRFRRNLRAWYAEGARDLPWRRTNDPYRIWISEIMLQQTTVAAVVPYFRAFTKRFPGVEELASASEEEVLRYWEGLGYYSRASNIHKTARLISGRHGGRFPHEVRELMKLPGIGRYTAGAIASIAFDVRAPIVEANTFRLYSRLLAVSGDPRSTGGKNVLWEFAERLLPRKAPGRFNQALMELGQVVCLPSARPRADLPRAVQNKQSHRAPDPGSRTNHLSGGPHCQRCPVRTCCRAFADGVQHEIPAIQARQSITAVTEASVAVCKGDRFLLRRRGQRERWAGLWDFPRFSVSTGTASVRNRRGEQSNSGAAGRIPKQLKQTLEAEIARTTGVAAEVEEFLTELRHSVTRFSIRLLCLLARYRSGPAAGSPDLRWVHPDEFGEFPLSVTGRKLAVLLSESEFRSEDSKIFRRKQG